MATQLPSTVVLSAASDQPRAKVRPDQSFQAQVLGQGGAKRGLRGGQPVLDAARAAYLDAEWRGPEDRRLHAGAVKTVVL